MQKKRKQWMQIIILFAVVFFASSCAKKSPVKVKIADRIGYEVECPVHKDDQKSLKLWLQDYMEQYKQKGLDSNLLVEKYVISQLEVVDEGTVRMNFKVIPKGKGQVLAQMLDGTYEEDKKVILCEWILAYEKKQMEKEQKKDQKKESVLYTITAAFSPVSYQNDQYNLSETKQEDEYEKEYMEQTKEPKIASKNTYRIYKDSCSISNDGGKKWITVPVSIEKLCKSADGNSHYNQLQKGSYILDDQKAIFVYGGTANTNLSVIKSTDGGRSWGTVKVEEGKGTIKYARVKFISFPTKEVGYIVVTTEKSMNAEGKAIFKTTDGGNTFSQVQIKTNIQEHCLYHAIFLTEQIGFLSMTGGTELKIYRTEDGGVTWNLISIPKVTVHGVQPFIQPEVPYMEDGKWYLLVGQGADGDYQGGKSKAKFISKDKGKSFQYTKEIVK